MSKKKKFLKIFLISFAVALASLYGVLYLFLNSISIKPTDGVSQMPDKRVNVLVIGVAKNLSDTIMMASYDMEKDKVDIFSIPRDTYYPRKGYNHAAQKKVNAAYGSSGAEGLIKAVEDITKVDIDYYVQFDYEAVKAVVDGLGGLKVEVPNDMNYDDPADDLHIHFKKGQVVKNGEDIVKLLRWRKNNKGGGYKEGDLGRIKMQQQIVKLGMEKVINGNIVANFLKLQSPITKYVKTSMTPKEMMYFANKAKDINSENIFFHTVPGNPKTMEGLSFFVINKDKLKEEIGLVMAEE
ncbi:LCP family protein [Lutispora saccharofermentans]|uniref:LCP family protein n=1 Tax=Lutispora saccharofermentans TaxID=3024236 RepID=A0ABT1NIB3_9FIRM|nr:LCP family protein [Lutispora saccharofermentans]MCQ1531010.1 LCP family protein [Lutispora saccharofermentans]